MHTQNILRKKERKREKKQTNFQSTSDSKCNLQDSVGRQNTVSASCVGFGLHAAWRPTQALARREENRALNHSA